TAQKTGDPVGVLDQVPGFVGEIHLDQHVTRENTTLGNGFLAALDFHNLFRWNQDLPKGRFQPCAFNPLDERFVHAFFHSGINVYHVPTLAHVCPLFPAQEQAIDDPLKTFIDNPQQEPHDRHEYKDDTCHLQGLFTRRPDNTLYFVIGVAPETQGATSRLAEPGNDARNDQAADEYAGPGKRGFAFEHRVAHNAGHNNKHRQTQLEAICITGNGFYVALRHMPACGATCAAAM